ncbi:hypothetical protein TNCV_1788711 [Trichonephila clavipes]|nr:hypothetical protein TNCV_1788711 [Trichonephila clavipes]
MVIRSEGAVEYVMVGVSRRPTQAIWRGKEIEPVQEDETDQAIEEPDEIMHINRDSESKYDKSDRHETFELNCNFQMLPKELYQEN